MNELEKLYNEAINEPNQEKRVHKLEQLHKKVMHIIAYGEYVHYKKVEVTNLLTRIAFSIN